MALSLARAGRTALIAFLAAALISAEQPKFSADQCAVLRQAGVDTSGICPQLPPKKEGRKRPQ